MNLRPPEPHSGALAKLRHIPAQYAHVIIDQRVALCRALRPKGRQEKTSSDYTMNTAYSISPARRVVNTIISGSRPRGSGISTTCEGLGKAASARRAPATCTVFRSGLELWTAARCRPYPRTGIQTPGNRGRYFPYAPQQRHVSRPACL